MSITPPPSRYADGIGATELAVMTGWKIAVDFIGVIAFAAVTPVVAPLRLVDAFGAVSAAKLVQLAHGRIYRTTRKRLARIN